MSRRAAVIAFLVAAGAALAADLGCTADLRDLDACRAVEHAACTRIRECNTDAFDKTYTDVDACISGNFTGTCSAPHDLAKCFDAISAEGCGKGVDPAVDSACGLRLSLPSPTTGGGDGGSPDGSGGVGGSTGFGGSGGSSGFGGASGSGGSGGSGDVMSFCFMVCNPVNAPSAEQSLPCYPSTSAPACRVACETISNQCPTVVADYESCAANSAGWNCDGNKRPYASGCLTQFAALSQCESSTGTSFR